jgi:hypothetical protein
MRAVQTPLSFRRHTERQSADETNPCWNPAPERAICVRGPAGSAGDFSAEVQGSLFAFGYLPENATAVVAVFDDGRRVDDDVVSNSAPPRVGVATPSGS